MRWNPNRKSVACFATCSHNNQILGTQTYAMTICEEQMKEDVDAVADERRTRFWTSRADTGMLLGMEERARAAAAAACPRAAATAAADTADVI
jgi:hypothetical protein